MQEYKFSKKLRILTFIVAPLLIGGFGYIGFIPFIKGYGIFSKIFLIALSTGLIFAMIMSIIESVKTKLVVDNKEFIKTRIFSVRTLGFEEIEGYRIDDNYIYLIPNNDKKTIKITKYFSDKYELIGYLDSNFKDLDEFDKKEEAKKMLSNKKYGRNRNEVLSKVKELKKITKPLNWVATAFALLLWFYPKFYELLVIVNIAIPIIAFVIILKSKGLIHILPDENSNYPTLNSAISLPPAALLIRTLFDYDIFNYQNIWLPLIFISAVLIYLLFNYSTDEFKVESMTEKLIVYPFVSLVTGIFIFAILIQINCTFDNKEYETFETAIVSKKISKSGKGAKTYKINVADWNGKGRKTEVKITKSQYSKLNANDKIEMILRPGLFNIPWYHIRIN